MNEVMMTQHSRRLNACLSIFLVIALGLPALARAAEKRMLTEMDLFKFVWVADPQISPDGSRVAFVRVWVNQKADGYDTALWIVSTTGGAARQFTAGPRDSNPR